MTASVGFEFTLTGLLASLYVVMFIFLNLTAFFISAFYTKKFEQPLINRGFIAAILLSVSVIPFFYLTVCYVCSIIKYCLLTTAAVSSTINFSILYYSMRKVRK